MLDRFVHSCGSHQQTMIDCMDLSGPDVIKLVSCLTQLSMKFVLIVNLKLLTIANTFLLNIVEHENFSANKYENANYCYINFIISREKFIRSRIEHEKSFITLGPGPLLLLHTVDSCYLKH